MLKFFHYYYNKEQVKLKENDIYKVPHIAD